MQRKNNRIKHLIVTLTLSVFIYFLAGSLSPVYAALNLNQPGPMELNGDTVEYSMNGNKAIIHGNVVVKKGNVTLYADDVDIDRTTNIAHAKGNVRLVSADGEIDGETMTFNFATMTGDFHGAKIISPPYFGGGEEISKVSENEIDMKQGVMTTCDLDKPHFHLFAPKVEVYPGKKMVAKNVQMKVGKVPLLYIPHFSQDLRDKKPMVLFTPGYDKLWGAFLLSKWRYHLNDDIKGVVHVDYRERLSAAEGIDVDYNTHKFGSGSIRTYYTAERKIGAKHFFQESTEPTLRRQRFKGEWRHKWDIDKETTAVLQYYKLSDSQFLRDYFKHEFDRDSSPDTYFLLTKNFTEGTHQYGTLSFQNRVRVNRFETQLERMPELRYDLGSLEIADTGLYLSHQSSIVNLENLQASPSEVRQHTLRGDSDNELSYPMKVGFLEVRPFVGGRDTYYSHTLDPNKDGSIRGIFKAGGSVSTKFYKIYDFQTDLWGLNINGLRHVITPTISHEFDSRPTVASTQLDSFDSIDSLNKSHSVNLSIENKLQTKRNDVSVDLVRAVWGIDYRLKEDPRLEGFDQITFDMDVKPLNWLTLYFDSDYDTRKDHLNTANFDLYINGGTKWWLNFGKRFNREVDDQITSEFFYKINPKWAFRVFERVDVMEGLQKEREISIIRDLHEWTADLSYNETRGEGSEIWMVFTLKAYPDMSIDFGSHFNKRKRGTQSGDVVP